MLRKIRRFTDDDEGNEFHILKDAEFLPDICYEDGSPIIITKEYPIVIKVGRKFARIMIGDFQEF